MYVAIWRNNTSKLEQIMAVVKKKVNDDEPSFVFYVLCYYAGTSLNLAISTQTKLDRHMPKVKQGFHWNIDKFITYVLALLNIYIEIGGKGNFIFDKVHEVLTKPQCLPFNSKTVL